MSRVRQKLLDFSWKCSDCGMAQKEEPHRKLSDHMTAAHGKRWSEADGKYVPIVDDEDGEVVE